MVDLSELEEQGLLTQVVDQLVRHIGLLAAFIGETDRVDKGCPLQNRLFDLRPDLVSHVGRLDLVDVDCALEVAGTPRVQSDLVA